MSLSVVINTKNMAETLQKTLESVHGFADEIIVVDMKSTDHTVEVAKKYTKDVFHYKEDLGFADPARNFALSKAKGEWILVLDADEEIGVELKKVIREILAGTVGEELHGDCYFLPRKNIIFGKWLEKTGWWPDYQLRLFRNGYVQWTDKVHTAPVTQGKVLYLPSHEDFAITHYNYQSVSQFIERLNRYTTLELEKKNDDLFTSSAALRTFSDEFLRRFFEQQGIDDGLHGLTLSLLQAMYEFVVYAKQWEKAGFSPTVHDQKEILQQLEKFQHDVRYWIADWHVKHTRGWQQLMWQLRRKIR